MIQWDTVLVAIGGTAAVAAGSAFFAKGIFDRVLDSRLKRIEDQIKQSQAERIRREAKIFDQTLEPLRTIVSLGYRARNAARDLAENPEISDDKRLIGQLRVFHDSYVETLFEIRALIPQEVFRDIHQLRHKLSHFLNAVEEGRETLRATRKEQFTPARRNEILEASREHIVYTYEALDTGYSAMLDVVQSHLRPPSDI
ncbi:MAG: hypothetical protein JSR59_21470 [Proteobacteria bacterium]|nr:hypothetical protein [Pseudomonadota bacterium]